MRKKQVFIMFLLTVCLMLTGCGEKRQREEEEVLVKNIRKENIFEE